MKLEFLLCGSPNNGFLSQIAFFRLCLNRLGGYYAQARVVAVFGDHTVAELPGQWGKFFANIEVHWAHEPGVPNPGHVAQHDMRFNLLDPSADLSFLCDADTVIVKPLDAILPQLLRAQALAGVIAHYHFPWPGREKRPEIDWSEIALKTIGVDIERPYRYTLMPLDRPPEAPFYINYGLLAGPPEVLADFNRRDKQIRSRVAEHLGEWWAPQVSLALACAGNNLKTIALPMRYNFPNDPIADALYPAELEQIVLLHYLRGTAFQRDKIFSDEVSFHEFLQSNVSGSNAVFQSFVKEATNSDYPFSRSVGIAPRLVSSV